MSFKKIRINLPRPMARPEGTRHWARPDPRSIWNCQASCGCILNLGAANLPGRGQKRFVNQRSTDSFLEDFRLESGVHTRRAGRLTSADHDVTIVLIYAHYCEFSLKP